MSRVVIAGNAAADNCVMAAYVAESLDNYLNSGALSFRGAELARATKFLGKAHKGFTYSHGFSSFPDEDSHIGVALPHRQLVLDCYEKVTGRAVEGAEGEKTVRDLIHWTESLARQDTNSVDKLTSEVRKNYDILRKFFRAVWNTGTNDAELQLFGHRGKYYYF